MATAMIAPHENSPALTLARQGRLMLCFRHSDNPASMLAVASRLALPENASIDVYCRQASDRRIGGDILRQQERFRPFGSFHPAVVAAKALHGMGLTVDVIEGPESGEQASQMLEACRQTDYILMTTAFSNSVAFGSQSLESRTVRLVRKPILFFRGDTAVAAGHGCAFAAVSLSERSSQVVKSAADYATKLGAPLNVVHVIDVLHEFSRPDNLMSLMCACELLGNSVAHPGLQTYPRLSYGRVAEVFTRADLMKDAAFIALGVDLNERRSNNIRSDFLRDAVVRNAPCPVLLVPTEGCN